MLSTLLRLSACWLVFGVLAWPAPALAPSPLHATLWSAVFSEGLQTHGPRGDAVLRVPRRIVDCISLSHDNDGLPFVVIDKAAAQLHVFDANGTLVGSTPILLGAAYGDESFPGIGEKPLRQVR